MSHKPVTRATDSSRQSPGSDPLRTQPQDAPDQLDQASVERIVREVAAAHRSRSDYPALSNENLIKRMAGMEFASRRVIIQLIDNSEGHWTSVWRRATSLLFTFPKRDAVRTLIAAGMNGRVATLLTKNRLELDAIYSELTQRLRPLRVGRKALQFGVGERDAESVRGRARRVLRNVGDKRLQPWLRSFRPSKESDDDLEGVALESAMTRLFALFDQASRGLSIPERVKLPPPPLPTEFQGPDRWDWDKVASDELREALSEFLPVLRGEVEQLPERIRQDVRTHLEGWDAQKRNAPEVSTDAEREATGWEPPDHSAGANVEERVDTRLAYQRLVRIAEERGQKARAFLEALAEGKNKEQASAAAGVSRRMGYKYLTELKRSFGEK